MKYLSVCSGIEAATVAWHPLGWQPWAFAEIDRFPCAVLKHHYPDVPNLGDMTRFREWPDATLDLLVGGTPCQSFSVAGLRQGLADPRGSLLLTYLALADRYRPRWLVWENVPGVLSADDGRAFGSLLGGLAILGYGFAYRVLDAQYFSLAQRRARVFVVGHLGDWRRAAAVLFERESLSGHPAPCREAGQVAPTLASRRTGGGGLGGDFDYDGGLIPGIAKPLGAHALSKGRGTDLDNTTYIAHSLRAEGFDASEDDTGRGIPLVTFAQNQLGEVRTGDIVNTLNQNSHASGRNTPMIAFDARQSDVLQYGEKTGPLDTDGHSIAVAFAENQRGELVTSDTMGALKMGGGKPGQGYPALQQQMHVRRLTARECERLQGFPDDYTLIPYRGKPASDGPRYKALGNSMAVPVMRWIGERIASVDAITREAVA